MRGKWLLISVLAVGAGVGLGALSLRHRSQPTPAAASTQGAAIISRASTTFSGTIRPQHVTGVGAGLSGDIEAFMANVGDEVYQGQLLARVGSANLESDREAAAAAVESAQDQLAKAEAGVNSARLEASRANADAQRARMALERAQKTFSRQQTLHAAGATPRMVYEKAAQEFEATAHESELMEAAEKAANDNVRNAQLAVDAARKALASKSEEVQDAQGALEAAEVRAPVDGLIVGRKGAVGSSVTEAGDQLFQIATELYALEVVIEPPPDVLKRIHPGQPALVNVLDLQTGGMAGEVKEIKDKEGQVVIEFNSGMPAVKPGMRADVRLKLV